MLKAIIHGLEHTYQNHGLGGMASAFMVLEIANTHYWSKEINGSNRSDASSQVSLSDFIDLFEETGDTKCLWIVTSRK